VVGEILMRKLVFIAVLCAFVATPALADFYGGMANYSQKYATGQGGEFRIEPDLGFTLSNSMYANSTRNQGEPGSFQSFCMEVGEHIYDNSHIKVSKTYVNGDPGSHAYKGGTVNGDDLGERTAYLYQQFALGVLEGYVYDTTGSSIPVDFGGYTNVSFTRVETAGVLQRVLWHLEDEGTDWNITNKYYKVDLNRQDERNLADYWYSSLTVPSGFGVGNVRVLQLYECYDGTTYSDNGQDQLYLTSIPGAVILGILGLTVAGLKLRKFA